MFQYVINPGCRNVDFGDILTPEVKAKHPYTTYDLVANIVHDGEPGQGTYRVHILHRATGQWYELQDLHVTQILPQMITLTEAYIQVNRWKEHLSFFNLRYLGNHYTFFYRFMN